MIRYHNETKKKKREQMGQMFSMALRLLRLRILTQGEIPKCTKYRRRA